MQLGASASYFNSRVGSAPIHVAAQSAYVDIIKLLLKNSHNGPPDLNVPNRDGLTAFHLLLGKLVDLTGLENKSVQARGPKPLSDEQLEKEIIQCFQCLQLLAEQVIFLKIYSIVVILIYLVFKNFTFKTVCEQYV